MTTTQRRKPTTVAQFAALHGLSVGHMMRPENIVPTRRKTPRNVAAGQKAKPRTTQCARVTEAIQAAEAALATERARADNKLYVSVFGAHAAAWDVPVSCSATGASNTSAQADLAQADADALYEEIFGKVS